ncbi:MAG: exonuclease domain-containing protein [Anaerolineae bacterium]
MQEPFELTQPLKETTFALFDVETTGLSPAYGDRVCEVACLAVRDGIELGRFESLVDPGRPISPGAFRVNRITPEMLASAPTFETIAPSLLALMQDAALVAHNAAFDLGFLAMELEIAQVPPPEGPVVDTLALSRRAYSFASNSLPAVARALDVEAGPAHRAMGDVWTMWQVLDRILWELDRRWSVTTLGQLLDFQGGPVAYPPARTLPLPPTIAEALQAHAEVRMRYVDARGHETQRLVRPLRVHEQRGYLYLVAHCHRAGAMRTFRLDRVVELALEVGPE